MFWFALAVADLDAIARELQSGAPAGLAQSLLLDVRTQIERGGGSVEEVFEPLWALSLVLAVDRHTAEAAVAVVLYRELLDANARQPLCNCIEGGDFHRSCGVLNRRPNNTALLAFPCFQGGQQAFEGAAGVFEHIVLRETCLPGFIAHELLVAANCPPNL